MALQGTIDSFALDDVLRLLGASSKSGRLIVNGDRGSAHLWLVDGQLVGGDTTSDTVRDPGAGNTTGVPGRDLVDVIFDVLRYQNGSFIFEADTVCPSPEEPMDIEPALVEACAALDEWREIIAVVPSLEAVVTLTPELPHPEVVIDQAVWTSIVSIGGGCTVGRLGALFGLGELPVSRLVRALHTAGFVEIAGTVDVAAAPVGIEEWYAESEAALVRAETADPAAPGTTAAPGALMIDDTLPEHVLETLPLPQGEALSLDVPVPVAEAGPETRFGDETTVFGEPVDDVAPWGDDAAIADGDPAEQAAAWADGGAEEGPVGPAATLDEALPPVPDAEELARQMSMLSPKAAQAVAAAAQADDGSS